MRRLLLACLLGLSAPASASAFTQSCAMSTAMTYGRGEPWVGTFCSCIETTLTQSGLMHVVTGDGASADEQALADRAFDMCETRTDFELAVRARNAEADPARTVDADVLEVVRGMGATMAASGCSDIRIDHAAADAHFERLVREGNSPEQEPYSTIWIDAATRNGDAVEADPARACADLRQLYGPDGSIVPGLVLDR